MNDPHNKMHFQVKVQRIDAHGSVKKYGIVFNTVSPGTKLSGTLKRLQS